MDRANLPEPKREDRELPPSAAAVETSSPSLAFEKSPEREVRGTGASAPERGFRFGDFRIVREIGRGGMGVVYEAEQSSLGRRVALKVLEGDGLDEQQIERFRREARAAARLHHTNIVPVFGFGCVDSQHYYVMQFIPGQSLDRVIGELARAAGGVVSSKPRARSDASEKDDSAPPSPSEIAAGLLGQSTTGFDPDRIVRGGSEREIARGKLRRAADAASVADASTAWIRNGEDGTSDSVEPSDSLGQRSRGASDLYELHPSSGPRYARNAARIALQVARALDHAHCQGTLHRDVKPANILVDANGTSWITDFGLAKREELADLTKPGDIIGTFRYMAPEQLSGTADARSDIYGLGVTLYELLTLRPAFDERDARRLSYQVLHEEPVPVRELAPVPIDLETIVAKAMARTPRDRYATAGELADDLERFLDERPIRARRLSALGRAWKWCRRNPVVAALSATALCLLVLTAVVASVGYLRVRAANSRITEAQERAEDTSEHALEALDRMFERFAPLRDPSSAAAITLDGDDGEEIEVPAPAVLSEGVAALLQDLLVFYDRLADQETNDPKYRWKAAEARRRVGDIRRRLGEYESAIAAYEEALSRYQSLAAIRAGGSSDAGTRAIPARSVEIAPHVASIENELGATLLLLGRLDESRAAHAAARDLLARIPTESLSQAGTYELARAHWYLGKRQRAGGFPFGGRERGPLPERRPNRRGDRRYRERDTTERRDNLEKAVVLLERLIEANPGAPSYRRLWALSKQELASVEPGRSSDLLRSGADPAAIVLEDLVASFPAVPEFRRDLVEHYSRIDVGRRGVSDEDLGPALNMLRKALGHGEKLVADHPNEPDYAMALVFARWKIGHVLERLAMTPEEEIREAYDGDPRGPRDVAPNSASLLAEAAGTYRNAIELQSSLLHRFPGAIPYRFWEAGLRSSLAHVLVELGDPSGGALVLRQSIAALEARLRENSDEWILRAPLADCWRDLAETLRRTGDDADAENAALEAERHRDELRNRRGRRFLPRGADGGPLDAERDQRSSGTTSRSAPGRSSSSSGDVPTDSPSA